MDALSLALNLEVDLGFATLSSISSYRDLKDFNGSWGWASDTVGTASYLEVIGVDDNKAEQWSQELRLSGVAFDDAVDWTVGGYLFEEDADNNLDVPLFRGVQFPDCAASPISCFPFPLIPGTPLAPLAGLPFGAVAQALFQVGGSRHQIFEATNSSEAIFGEVTWRFTDRLALTAGVRHTWDKREFTRTETLLIGLPDPTLACPPGTPPPVNGTTCYVEQKFNETTPRAILSYSINDDVMVYGGWSRGYSSGGFNQDVRMRPFDPEISSNWEGGLKSLLMDGRVVWNLPNGQTSIALWGSNLLDREYFGSAIDLTGGASPAGTNTKYWGEPRRFGIEFRHSLGG